MFHVKMAEHNLSQNHSQIFPKSYHWPLACREWFILKLSCRKKSIFICINIFLLAFRIFLFLFQKALFTMTSMWPDGVPEFGSEIRKEFLLGDDEICEKVNSTNQSNSVKFLSPTLSKNDSFSFSWSIFDQNTLHFRG
jgi:hypothetical protein